MRNIISHFTLKELEKITFRALQESFHKVMAQLEINQPKQDEKPPKHFLDRYKL